MVREFLMTSERSKDGILFYYRADTELFCGFKVIEKSINLKWILGNICFKLPVFIQWCKQNKYTLVEMNQEVSFDMMWDLYNDKDRSSKKRSLVVWNRLSKDNQIKAYYHYPAYQKNRGSAEKKYLETYLRAELWNN